MSRGIRIDTKTPEFIKAINSTIDKIYAIYKTSKEEGKKVIHIFKTGSYKFYFGPLEHIEEGCRKEDTLEIINGVVENFKREGLTLEESYAIMGLVLGEEGLNFAE